MKKWLIIFCILSFSSYGCISAFHSGRSLIGGKNKEKGFQFTGVTSKTFGSSSSPKAAVSPGLVLFVQAPMIIIGPILDIAFSPPFFIAGTFAGIADHINKGSKAKEREEREKVLEVAKNPVTSPLKLDKLAETTDEYIAQAIAQNPNTSSKTLTKLSQQGYHIVKIAIAKNPNTPSSVLVELAVHKVYEIRKEVAANRNTSPATLAKLAEDKVWVIRSIVAKNPNISLETKAQLQRDKEYLTKIAALKIVPPLSFAELVKYAYLRDKIAKDKNTTPVILAELAKDNDKNIRLLVAAHYKTPAFVLANLARDSSPHIREVVAQNANTSSLTLAELAIDDYHKVREAVALHANTSTEILILLAKDYLTIERAIANPNIPIPLLIKFSKKQDNRIRNAVAKNTKTPPQILAQLVQYIDTSRYVKITVAANPNTPQSTLRELAKYDNWDMKLALAKNPNTPDDILSKLIQYQDPHGDIRREALKNKKSRKR